MKNVFRCFRLYLTGSIRSQGPEAQGTHLRHNFLPLRINFSGPAHFPLGSASLPRPRPFPSGIRVLNSASPGSRHGNPNPEP